MQAAPVGTPVAELRAALLDEGAPIAGRYAAMFALRNAGGSEAVEALGAAFAARSALLKHEVAYVLGQMQDPGALDVLRCGGGPPPPPRLPIRSSSPPPQSSDCNPSSRILAPRPPHSTPPPSSNLLEDCEVSSYYQIRLCVRAHESTYEH